MNFFKRGLGLLAGLGWCYAGLSAAVPPPEKLLPSDTLVVVTVPDFAQAKKTFERASLVQLWGDDSMQGFREKFVAKFKETLLAEQERRLGVKLEDYLSLPQGQLTFALVRNESEDKEGSVNWVVLLDAKDKSSELARRLAELKQKWNEQGKKLKLEQIRDVEFTTLLTSANPLQPATRKSSRQKVTVLDDDGTEADGAPVKPKTPARELLFGQADSLLIISDSAKLVEKILVRMSGGGVVPLGEEPNFEASYQKMFREAIGYAWVNVTPFVNQAIKSSAAETRGTAASPLAPRTDKLMQALGLTGLKSLALNITDAPDGTTVHFLAAVPAEQRKGLFKLLAFEPKETAPPAFVPAEVTKFNRWRINGPKAWAALETMLQEVSPQIAGLVQMSLGMAGKEHDPTFDLKRVLINNLGDDVVTFEKAPKSERESAQEAPGLTLIGSPNADQLVLGVKAVMALMPPPTGGTPPKEREFLGRKIYSVPLAPTVGSETGRLVERNLSFAAANGYVALSASEAMLEEFLRGSNEEKKPLRETPGLAEIAQKVGGLSEGMFGYQNYTATIRLALEGLRTNPKALDDLFSVPGAEFVPGGLLGGGANAFNPKELMDFTLLPPFEKIAKYFTFSVYSGNFSSEGLNFQAYYPTPPELK